MAERECGSDGWRELVLDPARVSCCRGSVMEWLLHSHPIASSHQPFFISLPKPTTGKAGELAVHTSWNMARRQADMELRDPDGPKCALAV
jgi:hypothetical protein